MGFRATYTAATPEEFQQAQTDEKLWARFSFEPVGDSRVVGIGSSWSVLWKMFDPAIRADPSCDVPSTAIGRAIIGAHVFCRHYCTVDKYGQNLVGVINHPRYLNTSEVDESSLALHSISQTDFLERARIMEKTRGTALCEADWRHYVALRKFYREAAAVGNYVIMHIW